MSLMEVSHRTPLYEDVHNETIQLIRDLYKVPSNFEILFMQGGASSQFFMVPMNLLNQNDSADYIVTGTWTEKAVKEAKILGKNFKIICDTKESNYNHIPKDIKISSNARYVYMATNETIQGVQFKKFPETNGIPIINDGSSDIFSYPIDWKNIGMVFAGAQKNAGPSGVTIVIIRKDLIKEDLPGIPTMLRYSTHSKENSLYNTPATFNIFMVGLNMKWLKNLGGIDAMQKINEKKAGLIYDVIDSSHGFYKGHAAKDVRSLMNVTFTLPNEDLEKKFNQGAEAIELVGLKGHRSVGGMRASIYNAMPIEGCQRLADYMSDFAKKNK
jgi:phosphoserine aminotransferase